VPVTPVAAAPQTDPGGRGVDTGASSTIVTMEQSAFVPLYPLRWYFGEPRSSDAVSPDTSQPYPLDDLIGRIDELT
jgi:hypothetical protein